MTARKPRISHGQKGSSHEPPALPEQAAPAGHADVKPGEARQYITVVFEGGYPMPEFERDICRMLKDPVTKKMPSINDACMRVSGSGITTYYFTTRGTPEEGEDASRAAEELDRMIGSKISQMGQKHGGQVFNGQNASQMRM